MKIQNGNDKFSILSNCALHTWYIHSTHAHFHSGISSTLSFQFSFRHRQTVRTVARSRNGCSCSPKFTCEQTFLKISVSVYNNRNANHNLYSVRWQMSGNYRKKDTLSSNNNYDHDKKRTMIIINNNRATQCFLACQTWLLSLACALHKAFKLNNLIYLINRIYSDCELWVCVCIHVCERRHGTWQIYDKSVSWLVTIGSFLQLLFSLSRIRAFDIFMWQTKKI